MLRDARQDRTTLKPVRLLHNLIARRPVLCLWQLTARCDFRCRICSFWCEGHRQEDELSLAQIGRVVQCLQPLRPMMMSLAGGEPLLRDDLADIMRMVSRDHYANLITNGWYMTGALAERLYENGMSDAMVSIDYATPQRHDEQRGRVGAFERAVRALETLRDSRPNRRHRVRILTVLMDDNIEELEGLLLLAEELSVSLALTLYSDRLGKKVDRRPKRPVSDYLLELKRRHSCFDSASEYLASFDRGRVGGVEGCQGGRTFININQNGMISRCIDRNDRPSGNPLTQSWEQIMASLAHDVKNLACSSCWTSCRGIGDVITGPRGFRTYKDLVVSQFPR